MKEIGEKLRETRESIGISIDEAAEDLKIAVEQLENLENGNIEAFKDIFVLKYFIRDYSKYLGLDKEDMIDEFNEYLFDYTSKISLEDIKNAKKKVEDSKEKPKSPYTTIKKKKIETPPLVLYSIITIALIIIAFIIYYILKPKGEPVDNDVISYLIALM